MCGSLLGVPLAGLVRLRLIIWKTWRRGEWRSRANSLLRLFKQELVKAALLRLRVLLGVELRIVFTSTACPRLLRCH